MIKYPVHATEPDEGDDIMIEDAAGNPLDASEIVEALNSSHYEEDAERVPRDLAYQQAIYESVGSILSEYAAKKILRRVEDIDAANNPLP